MHAPAASSPRWPAASVGLPRGPSTRPCFPVTPRRGFAVEGYRRAAAAAAAAAGVKSTSSDDQLSRGIGPHLSPAPRWSSGGRDLLEASEPQIALARQAMPAAALRRRLTSALTVESSRHNSLQHHLGVDRNVPTYPFVSVAIDIQMMIIIFDTWSCSLMSAKAEPREFLVTGRVLPLLFRVFGVRLGFSRGVAALNGSLGPSQRQGTRTAAAGQWRAATWRT